MSTPESLYSLRLVTPDTLQADLEAGRISVHPDIADGLRKDIGGKVDFLVAQSTRGEPRGQIGVNWVGATNPETRAALGLAEGQTAPNITFMEVAEVHRRRGIGSALLRAVEAEIISRGHHRAFLSVAVGNVAAKQFYRVAGYEYTGLIRETPQFNRSPDGTYGDPTITDMEFWAKELTAE